MSTNVSKYFPARKDGTGKEGNKRKQSSTSSVSDSGASPTADNSKSKPKQNSKKQKQDFDTDENMTINETLQEIKDSLSNMPTKDDFDTLKQEMVNLTSALSNRIDVLESNVFDLQTTNDKLTLEINKLKGENKELHHEIIQKDKQMTNVKRDLNGNEQHGRQWNVRVFGIQEKQGETVEDCVTQCVELFNNKVGVKSISAAHIDIAHRTGRRGTNGKPRPILLRFVSRRQRGLVLTNRRKLKGTGFSIAEDLTQANHQLLKKATEHSATLSAWSSNGKILTKLKNGKIVKLDVDCDVNATLQREMS